MANVDKYLPPPSEMVVSPSPEDWDAVWQGAGDDIGPPLRRGEGDRLRLYFSGPGTQEATIRFGEPIEFLDGEVYWDPAQFDHDDLLSFYASLPATTFVENVTTEGNCNLVDTGEGYSIAVPADGDGTHDVDLALAVPVPMEGAGYWDCDYETGAVTASATPGVAGWMLMDVVVPGGYFIHNIPLGSPLGVFGVDNYRIMWLHQNWTATLKGVKTSEGAGDISAWAMIFRLRTA